MSKHGEDRVRERCGVPKKAIEKMTETAFQIGIKHGDTTGRLKRFLDYQWAKGSGFGAIKLYNNKVWLTKKYTVDKLTVDEIAEICGVTGRTIYNKLKEHGLLKK